MHDRRFASADFSASIMNYFDEFGDGRDVECLHFLVHDVRGESRHAGQRAEDGREQGAFGLGDAHGRVADRDDLHAAHLFLEDVMQAEEGEKEVGLDGGAHLLDQPQRTLRRSCLIARERSIITT